MEPGVCVCGGGGGDGEVSRLRQDSGQNAQSCPWFSAGRRCPQGTLGAIWRRFWLS